MKARETTRGAAVARPLAARPASAALPKDAAAPSRTPPIVDIQSLLGVSPNDLTPRVREAFMSLLREVESMRAELAAARARLEEMEQLADTDTLSPIANRRAFVRELTRTMAYAERYQLTTSLLFFDLNGLKTINDTLGHAAGDTVLMHVAQLLQQNVRGSDMVGRLGGDEYAVILNNVTDEQANIKAQQLLNALATTPVLYNGMKIPITSAMGIYTFGPGETPASVIQRADEAMYKNKRAQKAAQKKSA